MRLKITLGQGPDPSGDHGTLAPYSTPFFVICGLY